MTSVRTRIDRLATEALSKPEHGNSDAKKRLTERLEKLAADAEANPSGESREILERVLDRVAQFLEAAPANHPSRPRIEAVLDGARERKRRAEESRS